MSAPQESAGTGAAERVDLSGIPETMLWPLWNRAAEARRKRPLIEDPLAIELVDRIDYDFRGRFGKPNVMHAIRARVCDDLVRNFIADTPGQPLVVALGEGLETQHWRIGDERVRWVSVDVPEAIGVRRSLLPPDGPEAVECSALDAEWMDVVPAGARPFISASGLLMYFTEDEVRGLLVRIAERFPGAEIFFDTIPPFLARRSQRGWRLTKLYTAPPMPWGIPIDDIAPFLSGIPGLRPASVQSYADPFPSRTLLYRLLSYVPTLRRRFAGALVHARVEPS
ncbi:MAG: class I SAM-dependent methyltransferase [Chloroflexi bacterium]|nr:class I SAM-dependent methyltransferase [Chloroflexota bacterium]